MMKSSLSGFLLLLLLCSRSSVLGGESVVVRDFVHVQKHLTWQAAQVYCRSVPHADLATIRQSDAADSIQTERYNAWVGLYKPADLSSEHYSWIGRGRTREDAHHSGCGFVTYSSKEFRGVDCQQHLFFICQHSPVPDRWNYTLVPRSKTWPQALEYCRGNFSGLATLEDDDKLNAAVVPRDFPVWIGLRRDGKKWKWSKGSSKYRNWAPGEPKEGGDCVTISSTSKEMSTQNCHARFPFVCLRENLILVRENKTWEEALEHCRASNSELVSVQPGQDHRRVMGYVMRAKTDKVWTGLRFLAGGWLWTNKAALQYSSLPRCPPQEQRCGALSKEDTGRVESTDCLLKLNFLCYSSP